MLQTCLLDERLCPTSIFPDPWTLVMQCDLFAVGDCEPRKIIAHLHGIFISWYLSMFLTCPDHGMMMMMMTMKMTMTMTHTHTHIYIMFMYIHRYPHIRYLPTNTPQMCSTYAFTLFGTIESQRADDQRYFFWQCDKKVFSNDYLSCSLTFWLTDGLWRMKQDDLQHLLPLVEVAPTPENHRIYVGGSLRESRSNLRLGAGLH